MARPWLKVEPAVLKHPKTRALAKLWGCHPYQVVGFLVALWGYCLEYQEDGHVADCPGDVLDELAAPCQGQALGPLHTVVEALQSVGFADADGYLHDWDEFTGGLLVQRRNERERKRLARRAVRRTSAAASTGQSPDGRGKSAPRVEQSRVEESRAPAAAVEPPASLTKQDYATLCVMSVNGALNLLLAGAYRPLVATVERETADAWAAAGIPVELARRTCAERTAAFRSTAHNRQPHTLRYFDAAVREAHALAQGNGGAPVALTDAERMRAAREKLEAETA